MTLPEIARSHVAKVADWDAASFAHWLYVEIPIALEGPANRYPFRPLHYLFVPSLPLWQVIASIAAAMDSRCRAEFRAGVAGAIDYIEATPEDFSTFRILLQLVRAIDCTEACDAIVRKVGTQGTGAAEFEYAKEGFDLAFMTIAGLKPTQKTRAALRALITSKRFDVTYAPTALVALARNNFDLTAHLDLLRGMFKPEARQSERISLMCRELIEVIPLSELALRWSQLALHEEGWIFENLARIGFTLSEDPDSGEIVIRQGDGPPVTLEIDPALEPTLISVLSEVSDRQVRESPTARLWVESTEA